MKKHAGMSRMKLKRERSLLVEEECRAGVGTETTEQLELKWNAGNEIMAEIE